MDSNIDNKIYVEKDNKVRVFIPSKDGFILSWYWRPQFILWEEQETKIITTVIKVAIYVIWKITKIEGVCWINYFQQYSNLQLYYSYGTVTEGNKWFYGSYWGIETIRGNFMCDIQMTISQ